MAENKSPLEVKIKSGTFYLSSKTKQTGEYWKEVQVTNPQTGEELTRWHKPLSIVGNINYMDFQDDKFAGKVFAMLFKGEDGESYSLKIPVMGPSKTVKSTDGFFNSLALVANKLKKGDKVTMFLNSKNEDKNGKLYKNIITLDSEGKLIKSDTDFKDIPRWESKQTEDEFGDTITTYNASNANKFYINKAKEAIESFKSASEAPAPKKENTPAQPVLENDEDDLPF